jgi:hypothetical protein
MAEVKVLDPLKAIRANCIECMGTKANKGYQGLIRNCSSRDCPLWPHRFGVRYSTALKQGKDVSP